MNLRDPATARVESFTPTVHKLLAGEFDEGPGYATYRRRGTTDWLLIHTLEGCGRFGTGTGTGTGTGEGEAGVAGADVLALPGATTLVEPGTLHDYGVNPAQRPDHHHRVETELERWHFLFAHFHPRPDWLPLLDWPAVAPGIHQLRPGPDAAARIIAGLSEAVRYQDSVLPQGESLSLNALEAALLWCDTQNPAAARIDARLLQAIELIDRDLRTELDVPRLARAANLSLSRFAHLFRSQLGVTPQQFVERRRLDAAGRLLELTSRPVASVAAEVGFTNPLYFSTRFRRHTGYTPTAYRRR